MRGHFMTFCCFTFAKTWLVISMMNQIKQIASQWTQTSLRRLQDILKRSQHLATKPDAVKTSWRRRLIYVVLKMSDLRLIYVVLKTSDLWRLKYVCLRRHEDIQFTTSWRHLIYVVLKASNLPRLEDVWFTTSWRCL